MGIFFKVQGKSVEGGLQAAGSLAGRGHLDHHLREELRVFRKGSRQGLALLDVVVDGLDDCLELLVLRLFRQHPQGLDHRNAGGQDTLKHLTEDGKLLGLYGGADVDIDLLVQGSRHLDGDQGAVRL